MGDHANRYVADGYGRDAGAHDAGLPGCALVDLLAVQGTRRHRVRDRAFVASSRGRCDAGRLLYDGVDPFWLAEGVLAVPWWRVL
jgi:hypothetical protein